MARYYYDKHNIATSYTYYDRRPGDLIDHYDLWYKSSGGFLSFGWSSSEGYYGVNWTTNLSVGTIFYRGFGTYLTWNIVEEDLGTSYPGYEGNHMLRVLYKQLEVCSRRTSYSKGSYIETIVAEGGTYPDNGRQDGYWWVKGALAFPSLGLRIDAALKTSEMGWARIGNEVREIVSITERIDGALKEAT